MSRVRKTIDGKSGGQVWVIDRDCRRVDVYTPMAIDAAGDGVRRCGDSSSEAARCMVRHSG